MNTLKKRALSLAMALVLLFALAAFALADGAAGVELELLADDGTAATAVFDNAYRVYGVRMNVGGEDMVVDAIVAPNDGTMTVDKAVSGKGYLINAEPAPGMPCPTEYYGNISTSAGEHRLVPFVDGAPNTDSPYFAYTFFSDEWGQNSVMMFDILTYTAPDGSTVYIIPDEGLFVPAGGSQSAGDVEFELLADDGTVATAVLTGSYWIYNVRANVGGEDMVVDAIITPYEGTMTVDKSVSGKGFLGTWDAVPGMPVPTEYTGHISTSAGEHQLTAFVDGATNTDSPYFAYTFFSDEWGQDSVMMYDLITYTAPDGSIVCIAPFEDMFVPAEAQSVELELLAGDGTTATAVLTDAYRVYNVRMNVGGEDVLVDAIVTPNDGTMTVDKAVSGKGYLINAEPDPGMPYPTEYYGDISTSAGEHQLVPFVDGTPNTDSPYFAYTFFSDEWGQDSVMMFDILTYTAPDGSTVYIVPDEGLFVTGPEPQTPEFTDVLDWQKAAVDFVYEKGLMNGTGSAAFSPNEPMTLGMALTVMARASGVDTSSSDPWYKAGFDWAKANNVQFSGENTDILERQDIITMIWMLAGSPDADPSILDRFPDASTVRGECLTAVAWSVRDGIINGTEKGIEPSLSVTRAVYATILMRAYELF